MRRRLLVAGLLLLGLVLGAAVALGVWLWAQRHGDPMEALRRDSAGLTIARDSAYRDTTAAGESRIFRELVLATGNGDTIRLATSRPAVGTDGPLPVVVILAGLRTGRESLAVVERHGPNLLVGYEYPYNQETWYQRARLAQIPVIRRAVFDVPWQVTRVMEHLAEEPAYDGDRVSLLGYSFGALFVPATLRLAAEHGRSVETAILAFAGADIEGLMRANLRVDPPPLRRALAWTAASLLHPMEPEHHLPHIHGRFLLIRGAHDDQIPEELAARLTALTPEPKDVITLEGGHMNPRDPELTQKVVELSQAWLARQGAIDWPTP